jgi:hypothetical protein
MKKLLSAKIQGLKLVDQFSGPLKDVLNDINQGQEVAYTTNSFSLNLNRVK